MIIAITGLATSGKTTVANMLINEHRFHKIAMADPLKTMLNAIGIDREHTHGDRKEEPLDLLCGNTARHAMMTLGTEWGRELIGPDFWVRAWESAYRLANKVATDIVVDDVRFPNEVSKIRELGGVIIKVHRPGVKKGTHESETHVLPNDYVILNDGNMDDLRSSVETLLAFLKTGV